MYDRPRVAMITTHNRPELLQQCVEAIKPQVDSVLVLDNASLPPADLPDVDILYIPDQPPHLARFWNTGFEIIEQTLQTRDWYAAVLCDDAIAPEGWVEAVIVGMQETGAAIGCSNPWGLPHDPVLKTQPDHDIRGRMIGWAFVLDGSRDVRPDETMRWWYFDTDLDFQARANGGFVMVGGFPVPNIHPGQYTNEREELGAQTSKDREAFASKYGWVPW
jgi:hypothetical protein